MNDLMNKIQNNLSTFSKGQRLIAKYIIEHYDKAAFLTASKLGSTVGVSESTVVRFAAQLGYDGYPAMQKALQELIRDKTVLIIAHRLLTIKNADKILVLKDGQIEAEGTHEVLMKNSRTYADLWRAYTATADWQLGRTEMPV